MTSNLCAGSRPFAPGAQTVRRPASCIHCVKALLRNVKTEGIRLGRQLPRADRNGQNRGGAAHASARPPASRTITSVLVFSTSSLRDPDRSRLYSTDRRERWRRETELCLIAVRWQGCGDWRRWPHGSSGRRQSLHVRS